MNRITHEKVELDSEKESDEPDNQDQNISDLEEDSDEAEDGPVGVSLDDILEGDQDDSHQKKKLTWLEAPENEKTCEKGQKDYSDEFNASNLFIKMSIYSIILCGWYLVVHHFNFPFLEEEKKSLLLLENEVGVTFLTVMAIISYYQCSNASNVNPTKNIPWFLPKSNAKECNYCEKWKPERTHHCSRCGHCILRMDHHCPWICNCVGYRNHKAFFLFCFYTGIASLYFDYKATVFFINVSHGDIIEISGLLLIGALVCLFIIFPLGVFTFGLSIFHFILAMNNLTTLESISGINILLPSLRLKPKPEKIINKYDKGKLANLWQFFGETHFFWWWPTIPSNIFEGQNLAEPSVDYSDKFREYFELEEDENDEFGLKSLKPKNLKEVQLEKLFSLAEEQTKNSQIQIGDHILQENNTIHCRKNN